MVLLPLRQRRFGLGVILMVRCLGHLILDGDRAEQIVKERYIACPSGAGPPQHAAARRRAHNCHLGWDLGEIRLNLYYDTNRGVCQVSRKCYGEHLILDTA